MTKRMRIIFECENEAVQSEIDIAKVLRKIANAVEDGLYSERYQTVFDTNGNDIGRFRLKDETDES